MSRRVANLVLPVLAATLFAVGLVRLFLWRFEMGDIYPPYSSYRSDPLGCMALYEALGDLPGLRVARFLEQAGDLPEGRGACLLVLGCAPRLEGSADEARALELFMGSGGRLVIALAPPSRWQLLATPDDRPRRRRPAEGPPTGAPPEEATPPGKSSLPPSPGDSPAEEADGTFPAQESAEDADPAGEAERSESEETPDAPVPRGRRDRTPPAGMPAPVDLARRWGFHLVRLEEAEGGDTVAARQDPGVAAPLPPSLNWHGAAGLGLTDPAWQPLYGVGGTSVAAQRPFGGGSLVVLTDSYLLSNEALRSDLQPGLLSWIVGPSRTVLFDETHFGIAARRGVMWLATSYGLHGALAALLLLSVLFVWQHAARLVPPAPDDGFAGGEVSGRTAFSALRDLLRRHVPRERLLERCVEEWQRTAASTSVRGRQRAERLAEALARHRSLPRGRRDVAETYRRMAEIISERD